MQRGVERLWENNLNENNYFQVAQNLAHIRNTVIDSTKIEMGCLIVCKQFVITLKYLLSYRI